jgi:hypothetical protein
VENLAHSASFHSLENNAPSNPGIKHLVDGVRVDHVDGLSDPGNYCRKLRAGLEAARPGSRPYIVVEKILLRGEALPDSWETDGTTGYDFMDEVNLVQHDPRGEAALARVWARANRWKRLLRHGATVGLSRRSWRGHWTCAGCTKMSSVRAATNQYM